MPSFQTTALVPTNNPWQIVDQNNNVLASVDPSGNLAALGNFSSAAGPGTAKFTLTSAQLKALKATPVTLIAAPGAGKAILVTGLAFHYAFGTTAYTLNAGTIRLFQGAVADNHPLCASVASGLVDQTADTSNVGQAVTGTGNVPKAKAENVAITVANDGAAELTLGDGTLDIIVKYNVVTM